MLRFIDRFYESERLESGRLIRMSKQRTRRGRRRLLRVRFENLAMIRKGSITCPLVFGACERISAPNDVLYSYVADVVEANNRPNFMENFPINDGRYSFTRLSSNEGRHLC